MAIQIDRDVLEQACKNIIETILFCLPGAFKGTVYRIGSPPDIVAERITSGILTSDRETISWGLPQKSEYNPPGRGWKAYRDEPGRALEAMAWCVEQQRSWTADDPAFDTRSVRLQVEGVWEDYHHMEPVLVRKEDLYPNGEPAAEYPRNHEGHILWEDSPYAVVAVIKIHFRPNTIRKGGVETRIIKRLSLSLGTELLSYQLREQSFEAMRRLADDKLNSYNILADSLRNAVMKSGLVFSLIKLELSFLRKQWEDALLQGSDLKDLKAGAVTGLNTLIAGLSPELSDIGRELVDAQNRFLDLNLPPEVGEKWLRMQIEVRWERLLERIGKESPLAAEARRHIEGLRRSLYLGMDPAALAAYGGIPEEQKKEWVDLLYSDMESMDFKLLNAVVAFLGRGTLRLPYLEKTRKSLIRLKAVAETMAELEKDTNRVLREVLNHSGDYDRPPALSANGFGSH